jgi:hypothetical protein
MGFFEILLLSPGQILDLINSSLFLIYAVPILLPLESAITYFYLKKLKTYKSVAERKNILTTFWAYFSIKLFLALLFYYGAWLDIEMQNQLNIVSGYMIFYYLYSMGVCAAFTAYLVDQYLPAWFGKRQPDQPKLPPENYFKGKVVVDLGDSVERATADVPDCAGRTLGGTVLSIVLLNVVVIATVIFLISGGLDKYFGINKTADYNDLAKIIDTIFDGIWYVIIGIIIAPAVVAAAIILYRNHKSFSQYPFAPNPESPQENPSPEPRPDDPPPAPKAGQGAR